MILKMAIKKEDAVQHIFIIRHGERLDNVDYGWVRRAERPYDPPLTEDGVKEASEAGQRFKDKVRAYPRQVKLSVVKRPSLHNLLIDSHDTVKPLNSGHIGSKTLVCCREVVPISEVDYLATPPILSLLIGFYAEGCGLQEAESARLDQTRFVWAKIDKQRSGQTI